MTDDIRAMVDATDEGIMGVRDRTLILLGFAGAFGTNLVTVRIQFPEWLPDCPCDVSVNRTSQLAGTGGALWGRGRAQIQVKFPVRPIIAVGAMQKLQFRAVMN